MSWFFDAKNVQGFCGLRNMFSWNKTLFWKSWNHADPYIYAVECVSVRVCRKRREPTNSEAFIENHAKISPETEMYQIWKTLETSTQTCDKIHVKSMKNHYKSIHKSITSGILWPEARKWRLEPRKLRPGARKWRSEARKWIQKLVSGAGIRDSWRDAS